MGESQKQEGRAYAMRGMAAILISLRSSGRFSEKLDRIIIIPEAGYIYNSPEPPFKMTTCFLWLRSLINIIQKGGYTMISLSKGQKIDLTKTNPGLKKVLIGLGWDTAKYDGGQDFDLDAARFPDWRIR